jgi:transcriptional regulator with XRE-family HTH domain
MSKTVGKPAKFVLTPQQREIAEQIRHQAEIEKPEILAEGRRVKAAAQAMSAHLQSTMQILKAVRKAEGVTLDDVAALTGIQKASLSRLENNSESNVTINTLYRIADALNCDLHVSVVRRPPPKSTTKNKKTTTTEPKGKRVAESVGTSRPL